MIMTLQNGRWCHSFMQVGKLDIVLQQIITVEILLILCLCNTFH